MGECWDERKYNRCNSPKVNPRDGAKDGFGSYDGEPCNPASVCTGPEFGCIHGEE